VRLLRRQFEPQQGRILIDGQDIAHVTWNSLNEAIAEVPQMPGVFHRNVRDNIRIKLDQTKSSTAGRKGFQYDAGFTLAPGRYRMKFLVRENVSGKMGTFETRFTIPDLSAETSALKLSSVIMSSQREPLTGPAKCTGRSSVSMSIRRPFVRPPPAPM